MKLTNFLGKIWKLISFEYYVPFCKFTSLTILLMGILYSNICTHRELAPNCDALVYSMFAGKYVLGCFSNKLKIIPTIYEHMELYICYSFHHGSGSPDRCAMLILAILGMSGVFYIEQPSSSLLMMHDRMVWLQDHLEQFGIRVLCHTLEQFGIRVLCYTAVIVFFDVHIM